MYLLNHGIHNTSNFFGVERRDSYNEMSSDKFYKNENGQFIDVTMETNLFGGEVGYGLAVCIKMILTQMGGMIFTCQMIFLKMIIYI